MAQAQNVQDFQSHRSPLTPGLAAAAKHFGIQSETLRRHEQYEQNRLSNLEAQRDESRAKYDALKETVDELVTRIQAVSQAPAKAQAGDIQNIRTLLKQAYYAMERQQAELKGIRARTQRMERAALKADEAMGDVSRLNQEISGYQKALHTIRQDMAHLMDYVEGEGGLKDLAAEITTVKSDLKSTVERTQCLEERASAHSLRTAKLESDLASLRALVESNMQETAGVAGAMLSLREEMTDLKRKVAHFIIDQIKFFRKDIK